MWVFLLIAAIIAIVITLVLMSKKQPVIERTVLASEIESICKKLPIRIDAYTEYTSVDVDQRLLSTYSSFIFQFLRLGGDSFLNPNK